MKINNVNLPAMNPYKANDLKAAKAEQKVSLQADKLEISAEAKKLSEVSTYTAGRNERVQEIKAQVEAGTYKVDPEQLAKNLASYFNK